MDVRVVVMAVLPAVGLHTYMILILSAEYKVAESRGLAPRKGFLPVRSRVGCTSIMRALRKLVPEVRLALTRHLRHWILNPACLLFQHSGISHGGPDRTRTYVDRYSRGLYRPVQLPLCDRPVSGSRSPASYRAALPCCIFWCMGVGLNHCRP